MSSVKVILLLIAMGMVGLVLFLGYKLDMYEERRKRKEKNTKKQINNKFENDYTDFNPIRVDYKDEIDQTSTLDSTSFDFKKVTSKSNKYSEEFDKTAVIERIDLSKLEITDNDEVTYDNNVFKEPEVENEFFEKNEEKASEDEIEEDVYNYEDYDSSTMVFDTTAVKESNTLEKNDYIENEIEFKSIKSEKTRKSSSKKTSVKENKTKTAAKPTARKTTKNAAKTAKTNTKK